MQSMCIKEQKSQSREQSPPNTSTKNSRHISISSTSGLIYSFTAVIVSLAIEDAVSLTKRKVFSRNTTVLPHLETY
jgi:hypothetical protein